LENRLSKNTEKMWGGKKKLAISMDEGKGIVSQERGGDTEEGKRD